MEQPRLDAQGLWDWNLVTNRIHYSPRWLAIIGCDEQDASRLPSVWFERVHPEDRPRLLSDIDDVRLAGAEFISEHRLRHQDGLYRWMACRGSVIRDEHGEAIRLTGAHWDISADRTTDPLTGLPNRALFAERVTHALERVHRHRDFGFAVLCLDVRQAGVGEKTGPDADAALLVAVARRLETYLRSRDTALNHDLVARIHVDQFGIILDSLREVGDAQRIADGILAMLPAFPLSGTQVFLSASLGIALSVTGYSNADEMLRDASTASHRARTLNRSQSEVFDTRALQSAHTERQFEADLREALARREFQLAYQPIVSLTSYQIVGFEALVRWRHSVLGVIPPAQFVPIAERTGLVVPLGYCVVREACLQLKAWQEAFPRFSDLWMSVNLSGVQLKDPGLTDMIGNALRDSGLSARNLVLELTEGVAMDNPSAVKTVLMQLRAMGVRISLDDFGTGYSSLAYLHQLPVDALKVDRSFVRGITRDDDTTVILSTVNTMARRLGLHVIVEGIENEEQLSILRGMDCDAVQGFLLAKPVDVDQATNMLRDGLPLRTGDAFDSAATLLRRWTHLPRKWLTTAVALGVLTTVGFNTRFTSALLTILPPSSSSATDVPVQTSTPSVNALSPLGIHGGGLSGKSLAVEGKRALNAPPNVSELPKTSTAPSATDATGSPIEATPRSPAPTRMSLRVEHLHLLGACEGRLVVSRRGIEFVPDDLTKRDAFALTHREFIVSIDEMVLVLKSNARTYRFKEPGTGKDEGIPRFPDLVANVQRFR